MPVESTPTIRLDGPAPAARVAPTSAPGSTPVPGLTRVVVSRGSEVEPLMRTASAAVKALAERLESALRDAAAAERAVGDVSHEAAVEEEWNASLQVIRQEVEERRSRLAAELDEARRAAAVRVAAARGEAVALVRAAGDELASSLAGEAASPSESTLAPPLRPAPATPADPAPVDAPPVDAPPVDVPPVDVPPVDVPPAAASNAASAPPTGVVLPAGMPPFVAVMIPAADGTGQPSYVLAPTVAAASWPVMSAPAAVAGPVAPIPSASYPNGPADPAAPGQVLEPRPRPTARDGLTRMLHVDVILPLIAVAIVIVVLLAWLG
jgi:hypothetical protein